MLFMPLLYADALVDTTESLKYKEASILNEVFKTGHQKEVIYKYLKDSMWLDMCGSNGSNTS